MLPVQQGIYLIKNITNGKVYVGSAVNIDRRWSEHLTSLKKNKHHSPKLQNSFNKHGADAFEFNVIQFCKKEELIINEQFWMDHFDSYNKGYNCTMKAESPLGMKRTPEARLKMSISAMGNSSAKGHKVSKETRLSISKSNKARIVSEETRELKRQTALTRPRSANGTFIKIIKQ